VKAALPWLRKQVWLTANANGLAAARSLQLRERDAVALAQPGQVVKHACIVNLAANHDKGRAIVYSAGYEVIRPMVWRAIGMRHGKHALVFDGGV